MALSSATIEALGIAVLMGEIRTASAPTKLRTVLGSCVGIALWDRERRLGSLAHVVLPAANGRQEGSPSGKFADTAVPAMVEQLRKLARGESKLTARIAGGASMFNTTASSTNIGLLNKQAVEEQLKKAGIAILGHDLGGDKGRRLTFDLETGEVLVEIQGKEPIRL